MSSIKTNFEMPRGDDPVKQAQRLAQDLSSNFKGIQKNISDLINSSGINTDTIASLTDRITTGGVGLLDGVPFNFDFSTSGSVDFVANHTFTHNLGVVPSAVIITNLVSNVGTTGHELFSLVRVSWTSTSISVKLCYRSNIDPATGITGTVYILVLR